MKAKLFFRPKYDFWRHGLVANLLTFSPLLLFFTTVFKASSMYDGFILVYTVLDSVVFLYFPLGFLLTTHTVWIVLTAVVYGLFGCIWCPGSFAFFSYFLISVCFGFGARKYSVMELTVFRYVFNLYAISLARGA